MQYNQTIRAVLFSFSRTANLIRYISHIPLKVGNASPVVCLHGWAVACASRATKQTFAQRSIFLEGTLPTNHQLKQRPDLVREISESIVEHRQAPGLAEVAVKVGDQALVETGHQVVEAALVDPVQVDQVAGGEVEHVFFHHARDRLHATVLVDVKPEVVPTLERPGGQLASVVRVVQLGSERHPLAWLSDVQVLVAAGQVAGCDLRGKRGVFQIKRFASPR